MKKKSDKEKLTLWQGRLRASETAYTEELSRMDGREAQYGGSHALRAMVQGEKTEKAAHVRNISAEIVEAQVDSNLPQPKVTARRQEDEHLARIIENMLRNELDRMPFEEINDMAERTVPIQGGVGYLLEWDNTQRTHTTVGELSVSVLHPKQIIPQAGVWSSVEDMDYVILKLPQTKEYIRRRYGVDVSDESETEPEVRRTGEQGAAASDEMVTQYVAYYRNERGGIGLYSWVCDTQLEDLEDYQCRRLRRCAVCGAREPADALRPVAETRDGTPPEPEEAPERPTGKNVCPFCGGSRWEIGREDFEDRMTPPVRSNGEAIEMPPPGEDGTPRPLRVPYYVPDIYPVILQRNVSVFGRFLGDSDLDRIEDQQNTVNRIETKIIEKLLKSGSYMTLPNQAHIAADTEDMKVIRINSPAERQLIGVYDLQGEIGPDMAYLAQTYEEARQIIGITDSFQGRKDATATSGKAKEFAAAQSAGRLASKRVLKNAAYAALFEAMFKFKLAFADEPRPVIGTDGRGDSVYEEFNRWDFLKTDSAGELYWNDQFLFDCDASSSLAVNREAMWQETRMNLQSGAFGDPTQLETLLLFWGRMERLHYPSAGETKRFLEQKQEEQLAAQRQAMQQQAMQAAQAQRQPATGGGMPETDVALPEAQGGGIDRRVLEMIDRQARQDAARAAGAR